MGLPMALRLQARGYAVTVCDTNPMRAALATRHRLRLAPSAAEAARFTRCTVIAVSTQAQAQEVMMGEHGVLDVLTAGDCVMLCTTLPGTVVEHYARALGRPRHPVHRRTPFGWPRPRHLRHAVHDCVVRQRHF